MIIIIGDEQIMHTARITTCVRNRKRDSEEREQASIKGTLEPLASKGICQEYGPFWPQKYAILGFTYMGASRGLDEPLLRIGSRGYRDYVPKSPSDFCHLLMPTV